MNRRGFIAGASIVALFVAAPQLAKAAFQSNANLTVPTIAKLRSMVVPAEFGAVNVRGCLTVNDGGGGLFNITTVDPGADNGGTIIHSNTSGYYYVRQYIGPVEAYWFGITAGSGISGSNRTANSSAIQSAISVASATNNDVDLGPGTIEFSTTLTGMNGVNVRGRGNVGETSTAGIFKATQLSYFGSTIAIDLRGTGSSVDTRMLCCWGNFTLTAANNTSGTAQGIATAWNIRAIPLLDAVTITTFPDWGLDIAGQQWNVLFNNLRIDGCGTTVSNSCGLHSIRNSASPADDYCGGITFNNLQVEGCGTAGSTAGGINVQVQANSSSRGWTFTGQTIIEGNGGTDEIYFTNTYDIVFYDLYGERVGHTGYHTFMELYNCTGAILSGFTTCEDAAINLSAFQLKGNSSYTIANVTFYLWAKFIYIESGSSLTTGQNWDGNFNAPLLASRIDPQVGAKLSGILKPTVLLNKNGTDQTGVASGTATKVTFSTAIIDVSNAFTGGSVYPRTIGRYQVNAAIRLSAEVDATRLVILIRVNGSTILDNATYANTANAQTISISGVVNITSDSDFIDIYINQSSGSAQTISGAVDETWLSVNLI